MIILGTTTLHSIVDELEPALGHGQIQAIHQPRPDLLLLKIHTQGETHSLLISAASKFARLHLTGITWKNPPLPLAFCQNLRKHILNKRIETVFCHPTLPVVFFEVAEYPPSEFVKLSLVAEFYGQFSNLLLLGHRPGEAEPVIIYCLKSFTSAQRDCRPSQPYHLPAARANFMMGNNDLIERAQTTTDPLGSNAKWPFQRFLDSYFETEILNDRLLNLRHRLSGILKKEQSKTRQLWHDIDGQLKQVEEAEIWKKYGELIYAHIAELSSLPSEIQVTDYFNGNELISIPLDSRLSAPENAQRYFDKYKKVKLAGPRRRERQKILQSRLDWLAEQEHLLQVARTREDVMQLELLLDEFGGKKGPASPLAGAEKSPEIQKYQEFRQFQHGDWLILVGRDSGQNDRLITRIGKPYDYWLHVRDTSGSHTLLKAPRRDANPPLDALLHAAQIAAYYSQARNESKTEVIYTQLKHVFKKKGDPKGAAHCKQFKSLLVQPKRENPDQ